MSEFIKNKILFREKGIVDEYAFWLKSIARFLFGLMWLADGIFKLSPEFDVSVLIVSNTNGQNIFFATWYKFWYDIITPIPEFWKLLIAFTELGLAFCLIFGFMRKIGYLSGLLTSLVIWSVPEHFGGPYDPATISVGTGIIYAMVFLLFIVINAMEGPSRYSLDYYIEQKYSWWRIFAEFSSKSK